jgi:hypothetical protein
MESWKKCLEVQMNANTAGALFMDLLKLKHTAISPVASQLDRYAAGSTVLPQGLAELADDQDFCTTAEIIADPAFLLKNRTGSSLHGFGETRICLGKKSEALAVVSRAEDGFILRLFHSPNEYALWWTEKYASRNTNPGANYVPQGQSLESMLLILQVIDSYRRVYYQNALAYETKERFFITAEAFARSMHLAVKSRDFRWLLPAFIMLNPGLSQAAVNITSKHLEVLTDLNFLKAGKNATGEDLFLFGEAGVVMGQEFLTSWYTSHSFEPVTTIKNKGIGTLFIAPTALTNHVMETQITGQGTCSVVHQNLTENQLAAKIVQMVCAVT